MIIRKLTDSGKHTRCIECKITYKYAKYKKRDIYTIISGRKDLSKQLNLCTKCLNKLKKILNGEVKSD